MIDISIIMPVYNSEKYLEQTINSVLSQDYPSFELILVDDGSTDNSPAICDKFAKSNSRVVVIHKDNGGICNARNTGLKRATGKYIGFCDNDDLYMENLISDNMKLALQYEADVVRYSRVLRTIDGDNIISEQLTGGYKSGFVKKADFKNFFGDINKSGEGIWAGIYKRSFLEENHIHFDESMRFGYEDLYFITQIYMCEPSVALNEKTYYCWLMRYQHSTSGKTDVNNTDSLIKCLELKEELINKLDIMKDEPQVWLEELSKRIYTVVRYVSPVKIDMKLKNRMAFIKRFRASKVFSEDFTSSQYKALKAQSKSGYLVLKLFMNRHYYILYKLIIIRQKSRG